MLIQVNTDNHTQGSSQLTGNVQTQVEEKLRRHASRITRVEVQLTDENSAAKGGGDDQRCLLEVRMSGMKPISVTNHGSNVSEALGGAITKMQNLIESTLGKLGRR
jgi:hypothetical protein